MTTTISADNGSVSGSAGLKMSSDSSGVLALQTGANSTAMTLDTSGNVGIGTTSPADKLDVTRVSSSNSTGGLTLTNTDNSGYGSSLNWNLKLNSTAGNWGRIYTEAASTTATYMAFQTTVGSTLAERMRIDSSGMLGIGTTSAASSKLSISGTATLCMMKNESATDGTARNTILFRDNGDNNRGSITVSTSGTVYNTTSDYRLKENITPMIGALAKISQLKPVTYKWKETGDSGQGFIAHELAEVVPECVTGEKDAVETRDGKEFIVPQGIDTSFLVATLTAALQETKALIDTQAETINAQSAALAALTARIVALEGQ